MSALTAPIVTAVAVKNDPDFLPGELPYISLTVTNEQAVNLVGVNDASFEHGIGSAESLYAILSDSSAQALDGSESLKAQSIVTSGNPQGLACPVTLGPYPLEPDTEYSFTSGIRAKDAGISANVQHLIVEYFDDDENLLATTTQPFGATTTSAWTSAWVTATSPPATDHVLVIVSLEVAAYALAIPTGLTVTPTGTTGSTPWGYQVAAVNALGTTLACSQAVTVTGNALLSIFNSNALAWTAVSGATSYQVFKGTQGKCSDVAADFPTCAALEAAFSTCALLYETFFSGWKLLSSPSTNSYHDTGGSTTSTAPATQNTTGESNYIDCLGILEGATTTWTSTPPGGIIIVRNDGSYVLGASPLFPLPAGYIGQVFEIADYDAPFGQQVTYNALISAGGAISTPGPASAAAVMGQAPDTCALYDRLGWAKEQDQSVGGGLLLEWLSGIGQMLWGIDAITGTQILPDGSVEPGWSQLLDIERCPTWALPWLGQFVGARFPSTLRDDQQRFAIMNSPGWARGSAASILAAASAFLLPGFVATLLERTPDPYSLTIEIPTAGVVGDATCGQLALSYSACSELPGAFATCAALWSNTGAIESNVLAGIPAGLVPTISFT